MSRNLKSLGVPMICPYFSILLHFLLSWTHYVPSARVSCGPQKGTGCLCPSPYMFDRSKGRIQPVSMSKPPSSASIHLFTPLLCTARFSEERIYFWSEVPGSQCSVPQYKYQDINHSSLDTHKDEVDPSREMIVTQEGGLLEWSCLFLLLDYF